MPKERMQSQNWDIAETTADFPLGLFPKFQVEVDFTSKSLTNFPKRHALYNPLPKEAYNNRLQTAVGVGE
jgi:hypothetical protein